MKIQQFVKLHRNEWQQLEEHINTMHKHRKQVTGPDIDEFHALYRKAAQHLSYSQTYFPGSDVSTYLNDLVAKSHNLLYKDQVSSFKQIRQFFTTKFIGMLLEQWKAVFVALVLFSLGGMAAFLAVLKDPLAIHAMLPSNMTQGIDPDSVGPEPGAGGIDSATMSAQIMTNNIKVAFLAFCGGITFGLLTTFVMVQNGLIVGALAGLYWHSGLTYEFWAFIVPHGMIELTAIFIAGGAGLLMGYKLFAPGAFSRGYQLKYQAKRSVQLLLGTLPLFVIAGIIEGFITPADLSLELKYTVALITVIGMLLYGIIGKILLDRRQAKATLGS